MGNEKLNVKMLGTFSMTYKGKTFSIERNNATKVNQLLQLLLYYHSGIERTQLLDYLFDGEVITNPSNSLRALVFRLRKVLPEAGLPNDEYVNIKKGVYSWTELIPVECDAHEYIKLVDRAREEADKKQKLVLLKKAFDMYDGCFLPMVIGQAWTIQIDELLKKYYTEATKELFDSYVYYNDFDALLIASEKAVKIYPYNEWQYYQMQALIELKREKEAIQLYEKTENMMFEELGVSVSKEMTQMLDKLGAQVKNRTDLISEVKNNLDTTKKDEEGAFFCSYPTFLESYRYIKRVINRSGHSAWLMLCTLTDGKGYALDAGNRLDGLSEELANAISKSCRGMDMYTKYSDNQYLILLLGIEKDDCAIVQNRIAGNMCKESRKRYIQYHLAPINQPIEKGGELENIINKLEHK